jgi:hypothetical protein
MVRSRRVPRAAASALAALLIIACQPAGSLAQVASGTWTSLAAGSPAPSPRREFAAVYDGANHRYLVFAGAYGDLQGGYQLFNEIWALSLTDPPTWSLLPVAGPVPGERHSPQWGYDPARDRVLVFGGYGRHYPGGPYEYLNDVWQLSLAGTPAWTELFPSGTPPTGRLAGTAVYDVYRQRFVGFGGTVGQPVDTWALDLSGDPAWIDVVTDSTAPDGGYGMTSVFDPVRDRMVIFGGSTSDGYYGVHNDVFALELRGSMPAWHRIVPQGPLPEPRRTLASIYDPLRERMVIFGGWDSQGESTSSFLNDTWALSLSGAAQWSELAPGGGLPTGRDAMAAAYDPVGDRMVVYGGWTGATMLGDTWFLGWGGSGQAASMTASAEAEPSQARIQWSVQNAAGPYAAVYRSEEGAPWTSVATVEADATGVVTYVDGSVEPGGRYGYLLVVPSRRGETFGGEAWVDIPGPTGTLPPGGRAFALESVRPNPVVDRFAVGFVLPDAAPARLELFDVAGRRVLHRQLDSPGAGRHVVQLGAAADYRPGMYFLRLSQAGSSLTGRVVIGGA